MHGCFALPAAPGVRPPSNVTVETTPYSATVTWFPAFNNGLGQHYVLWWVFGGDRTWLALLNYSNIIIVSGFVKSTLQDNDIMSGVDLVLVATDRDVVETRLWHMGCVRRLSFANASRWRCSAVTRFVVWRRSSQAAILSVLGELYWSDFLLTVTVN